MTYRNKAIHTALLMSGVASLAMLGAPAVAQDAGATPSDNRDVITVTARRREESLLDVPISVTAFSGTQLEQVGAQDITFVGQSSPNVTLEVSRGTNTTLTAFIRGVGQQDPVAGFEAGVGLYLDDVYLNRPQAAVLDIYDVERIEVLRGPQGTLYGRNTIGGAIKYVTRRLSTEPEANVRVNVGSYNQIDVIASGSAPLSDTFRVGGAIARFTRDGFGTNLISGDENYNKDSLAFRASAEFEPNDRLFFRVAYDNMQDDSNARQGHRLLADQFPPFTYPVLDNVYDTRAGLNVVEQEVTGSGISFLGEFQINDRWTVRNILAQREDSSTSPIDFDSLPEADLDVPAIYENEQFSEEFQLLYEGDRLAGSMGFYYLDANASTVFDVLLATTGTLINLPGLNAQTFGNVDTNTWSIFADFTYDVSDVVTVSVGGRYTVDERSSNVLRRTYIGGFSEFFGGTPTLLATTSNFTGSEEWTDFSPRASISFQPDSVNNFYLSYSQGFKGGGFDPRGQTTAAPDLDLSGTVTPDEVFQFMMFEPEEVDSFEAGWKVQRPNYRHALAVFYADYTNVQVPGSIGVDTDNDGIADTFSGVTTNAGAATLTGIEFEGMATLGEDVFRPGDAVDLGWTIGYIDGEYDQFINAFGVDVSNTANIQNTPDWTASTTISYSTPVAEGDLNLLAMASYRGDSSQFEFPSPLIDQEAFTLINASAVWSSDSGAWQLGLHGRNLTDERYVVAGYDFVNVATPLGLEGTLTAFYGDPRTVTATVAFRY
jgi:iron complex outermembrane recepter protein